ncbi:MAG: AraC family transcriptional regulator [Clostridiaceae bacterium]|nr:AraC family transcriptional regulator [Clostridiaceae bacterium]
MKAFHEQRFYPGSLHLAVSQSSGMDFLAHWHDEFELFFVFKGCQGLGINNQLLTLTDGQIGIVAPWDIHYYERTGAVDGMMLIFPPELLGSRLPLQSGFWSDPDQSGCDGRRQLLESLLLETTRRESYYELMAAGLLHMILAGLLRAGSGLVFTPIDSARSTGFQTMQSILSYLAEHYREPVTREALAARFHLCPSHLSRTFKAATGLPLPEYVTKLRLENACRALRQTDDPIIEIAYGSGFESIRTFNRAFLRYVGQTPGSLRNLG